MYGPQYRTSRANLAESSAHIIEPAGDCSVHKREPVANSADCSALRDPVHEIRGDGNITSTKGQ